MSENTKDLWDCVGDIMKSPNYGLTEAIKLALRINPRPFYGSFGYEETVKKNIEFMAEQYKKYIPAINVSFRLETDKMLRGLIMQIPECKAEMDSLYLVIAYQGTGPSYYVCEYMDGNMYSLRRDDGKNISLFTHTPSANEVWNAISSQYESYEPDEAEGLYISHIYIADKKIPQYITCDYGNHEFIRHWFGNECKRTKLDYDGHNYWILYSPDRNDFLVMGDNDGNVGHLQESDLGVIPNVVDYCVQNIGEIKKQPSEWVVGEREETL